MSLKVVISSDLEQKEWDDNLCLSKFSTIYQSYNWQKLYKTAFGSKPFFIIVKNNDKIVGQLACLLHKKMLLQDANIFSKQIGNILNVASSLWWYHGPIIHDQNNYEEILTLILESVEKIAINHNVANIRGISSPFFINFPIQVVKNFHYAIEPRLTFMIDLDSDLDDLYASLKKDTRYYIRKSELRGFEFKIADNIEDMKKFQDLKAESFKAEGKKPFRNMKFWKTHWEILKKNGLEELILAKDNNKIKGTIITLLFNGNTIQHALANSPGEYHIGTFLTWNTLKWLKKMNFHTFDFAGVDPNPKTNKEKGIFFYAEKFGGKKMEYYSFHKIVNRKKFYLTVGLKDPKRVGKKYISIFNNNTI